MKKYLPKYYLLLTAFISMFASLPIFISAQQLAQYSLVAENKYAINSAVAGVSNNLDAFLTYRSQWVGLAGNPTTQQVNFSFPIGIIKSGVGFLFENENIGASTGLRAQLGFNKIFTFGENIFSLGVNGGFIQGALDGAQLRTPDGDYKGNVIDHKDNILNAASSQGSTVSVGVSAYFKNSAFEGGISASNINEPSVTLSGQNASKLSLKRHYNAFLGYEGFHFSDIILQPFISLRTDATETQADLYIMAQYLENIYLGVGFRGYNTNSKDALIGIVGFKLNQQLNLFYGYDLTLSPLNASSRGSHEIGLKYKLSKSFGKGKLPPIIFNPRI